MTEPPLISAVPNVEEKTWQTFMSTISKQLSQHHILSASGLGTWHPFGYVDRPTEKHRWLICCERKTLFQLKNKLKSTDYKPNEHCSL
jgi:hypothetical protein